MLLSRLLLGCVLIATGVAKLLDLAGFARVVVAYGLLPTWGAALFSRLLPLTEIGIGLCLLSGRLAPWPGIAAAGLFSLFAAAIAMALLRGMSNLSCGYCGSRRRTSLGWGALLRNLGLIALSVLTCGTQWVELNAGLLAGVAGVMWLAGIAVTRVGGKPDLHRNPKCVSHSATN